MKSIQLLNQAHWGVFTKAGANRSWCGFACQRGWRVLTSQIALALKVESLFPPAGLIKNELQDFQLSTCFLFFGGLLYTMLFLE